MSAANTLFLRLEGPMQAWGDESKFAMLRTREAPTRSGVSGLLCAALGVPRPATPVWLRKLAGLRMGARIDAPGVPLWDFHTTGAGMMMRTASGDSKPGPAISRREYLHDASFLVALQGEPAIVAELEAAVTAPRWTLYLGRKCCPPSRPLLECRPGFFPNLVEALASVPWCPSPTGKRSEFVESLLDWRPTPEEPEAPDDAFTWYDMPLSFDPPGHHLPRLLVRRNIRVDTVAEPLIGRPRLPRDDAEKKREKEKDGLREERFARDRRLCVFCKSPAKDVHHVVYPARTTEDLRSLCRLCHKAVTMIEYDLGMMADRVDPTDGRWRSQIIRRRDEIIRSGLPMGMRRGKTSDREVE